MPSPTDAKVGQGMVRRKPEVRMSSILCKFKGYPTLDRNMIMAGIDVMVEEIGDPLIRASLRQNLQAIT